MPFAPPVVRPHGYTPARAKRERDRALDQRRGSASSRGYGSRWRKARALYIKAHPLCAKCESEGRITPTAEVDHIIPHCGDAALFWNEDNWQPLCKPHHSAKTMAEVQERGKTEAAR